MQVRLELFGSGGVAVIYKDDSASEEKVLWWNKFYKAFGPGIMRWHELKNYRTNCWSKPSLQILNDNSLFMLVNGKCQECLVTVCKPIEDDTRKWGITQDGDWDIDYKSMVSWSNECKNSGKTPGIGCCHAITPTSTHFRLTIFFSLLQVT